MKKIVFALTCLVALAIPGSIYAADQARLLSHKVKAQEMLASGDHLEDELLIVYKDQALESFSASAKKKMGKRFELRKSSKQNLESDLARALAEPTVLYAQPNFLYSTEAWVADTDFATPDDYNLVRHWYYEKVNLRRLWKKQDCESAAAGCGGSDAVTVAVIDTGLAVFDYDDSAGVTGANFIASPEYSNVKLHLNAAETAGNGLDDDCNGVVDDVNGFDSQTYLLLGDATCTGGVPDVVGADFAKAGIASDTYGHGTFVTGLISSNVDNADSSVSPAFNITVLPIAANIHFNNSFSSSAVIAGINYAIAQGVDVINMSLGGTGYDPAFNAAVQAAHAAGIVVVAASGNSGVEQLVYPGAFDNVIAVGALHVDDTRASYSTYGNQVDLMAYVGNGGIASSAWQRTLSCMGGCNAGNVDSGFSDRYGIGTSYAAPQVAAAAALVKSLDPALDNNDIEQILIESAQDRHVPGKDKQTGWGNIDMSDIYDLIEFYNTTQPTSQDMYRFYNVETGAHLYVNKISERDKVIDTLPQFQYEGEIYKMFNSVETDTVPVHRFYNKDVKIHFYTSSESEKNKLIEKFSQFLYEGEAFFVYPVRRVKTDPIYRFYNYDTGAHLYVRSESERYKVLTFYPQFYYEGIAYYVPDF